MCNVLLGGAIGDALGMPFESQLPNYQPLLDWDGKTFYGSEYHGLSSGQFTDDSQFSITVAESLIQNIGFNPEDLANRYVELFTSNKIRGYGKTTLSAIQNLQSGKSYKESGIVGSYGNGTAMRAAPFGVYYKDDLKTLIEIVKIDSAITHNSEEAEAGALAIAIAAYYAANKEIDNLLDKISEHLPDSKVKKTVSSLDALLNAYDITPAQALRVLGTRADVRQTVPSALYCFIKCGSYHEAVKLAIRSGGDCDTTASIVGALFGAYLGLDGIPEQFYVVEDFDYLLDLDYKLFNKSLHVRPFIRTQCFPRVNDEK